MLISQVSSKAFKDEFSKRFSSFAKRSPVTFSMVIKIHQGEEGVLVTHVNSNKKYFFPFPIGEGISVRDFIAQIKAKMVEVHYPRIIEEILEKHEFTNEELAKQLETTPLEELQKYEMRVVGTRQYRIDKVLLWKNIFILVLENSTFSDDEIGSMYRYKLNISPLLYLRNYRNNKFQSLEEASSFFFSNAILLGRLNDSNKEE